MNVSDPNNRRKRLTRTIPRSPAGLIQTAERIIPHFIPSRIELFWKDKQTFQNEVRQLKQDYQEHIRTNKSSFPIKGQLQVLDSEINSKLRYVKTYLIEKFGRKGYLKVYANFGIHKRYGWYFMPRERNKRQASLGAMVTALEAHDFTTQRYGLSYWVDLQERHEQLLRLSIDESIQKTTVIPSFESRLQEVRKVLLAIYALLEIQFPNTYKEIAKDWGFYGAST